MTVEEKRRGPGALAVAAIFLAIAVAAYVTIEWVQRHRFTRLEDEAHAVVADFAASVRFDLDESRNLVLRTPADSRGVTPTVYDRHWEGWDERGTTVVT